MKLSLAAALLLTASSCGVVDGLSFTRPMTTPKVLLSPQIKRSSGMGGLQMISTGDDRSERLSLDISKTTYTSLIKAPKDAYIAVSSECLLYVVCLVMIPLRSTPCPRSQFKQVLLHGVL